MLNVQDFIFFGSVFIVYLFTEAISQPSAIKVDAIVSSANSSETIIIDLAFFGEVCLSSGSLLTSIALSLGVANSDSFKSNSKAST